MSELIQWRGLSGSPLDTTKLCLVPGAGNGVHEAGQFARLRHSSFEWRRRRCVGIAIFGNAWIETIHRADANRRPA
jgi:hypothetical protein